MREKYYIIVSIVLSMLVLSGCSTESKYSEEETDIVADYVAQTVIKHSEGYDGKLVDVSNNPFLLTKEESFVDSLRDDKDSQDLDSSSNQIDKVEPAIKKEENSTDYTSDNQDNAQEVEKEDLDINKVLNFKEGIETYVEKCEVLKEYTSNSYVIDIKDDEKLVKVEFKIKNTTANNVEVKVDSTKTSIKLATKDDTYMPLITAIENDFMFYNKTVKGNSTKKAVLMFNVPKATDIDDLSLEIQGIDCSTSISLNT